MSRIQKRLQSWRNSKQPVPVNELYSVLDYYFPGMYRSGKGSHGIVIAHPRLSGHPHFAPVGELTIPISGGQQVKHFYIKRLLLAIDIVTGE